MIQYNDFSDHCILINYFGITEIYIRVVPLIKLRVSQFIFGEELSIVSDILERERDHPFDSLSKILIYFRDNFIEKLTTDKFETIDVFLRIIISRVHNLGLTKSEKILVQDFILTWAVLLKNIKEQSNYGEKPQKQYDLRRLISRKTNGDKFNDLPF